jgi:hypothetical protein
MDETVVYACCIGAYSKLKNPIHHALRRLPTAGVFFVPPPTYKACAHGPDQSDHHECSEAASTPVGSKLELPYAPPG